MGDIELIQRMARRRVACSHDAQRRVSMLAMSTCRPAATPRDGMPPAAGSLGQAISQAGGIALARKLRGDSGRVWVFMSDGEFQEGQTWEAFAAMAFHRLDNLGAYVDANGQQCDGKMDSVMNVEPLKARLEAFGAQVAEVDGHDATSLAAPAEARPAGKPLVVLARTDPCRGLDLLRRRIPKLHYVRFKNEEERQAYQQALAQMGDR